jgi:hypothetical protein
LGRGKGRPKKIWMEVIRRDMSLLDLDESMTVDRKKGKERIYVDDHIVLY